jgi:sporulation protein YlmC with PRC-barrel domain
MLEREHAMTRLILAIAIALSVTPTPHAQTTDGVRLLTTLSPDLVSVTTYYDQNVYDSADQKIGKVDDLLLDKDGQILVAMISVGEFLSLKRKSVAIPFPLLQVLEREHKPYLVLDADKRALREARAFKYDRTSRRWQREEE